MKFKPHLRRIKSIIATKLNIPLLYTRRSYSQEGEDLILQKIFHGQQKGFYIDVGAHHPFRYSNTQLLYKQGWNGINIDANPNTITLFKNSRKRDANLAIGVSAQSQTINFYQFEDSAVNTFSQKQADLIIKNQQSTLIAQSKIPTRPLSNILKQHLPASTQIDLLNVDVEGLDLEVLQSNNWKKYQPKVIVVEILPNSSNQIHKFILKKNYSKIAQTINSHIYKKQ